jgi:hypothetical protein
MRGADLRREFRAESISFEVATYSDTRMGAND